MVTLNNMFNEVLYAFKPYLVIFISVFLIQKEQINQILCLEAFLSCSKKVAYAILTVCRKLMSTLWYSCGTYCHQLRKCSKVQLRKTGKERLVMSQDAQHKMLCKGWKSFLRTPTRVTLG